MWRFWGESHYHLGTRQSSNGLRRSFEKELIQKFLSSMGFLQHPLIRNIRRYIWLKTHICFHVFNVNVCNGSYICKASLPTKTCSARLRHSSCTSATLQLCFCGLQRISHWQFQYLFCICSHSTHCSVCLDFHTLACTEWSIFIPVW